MKKETVEIYSGSTNQAVMKHPDRHYPGVLFQGDTLYSICSSMDDACKALREKDIEEAFDEMNEIRNMMWEKLNHYKVVLGEHDIDLPFNQTS